MQNRIESFKTKGVHCELRLLYEGKKPLYGGNELAGFRVSALDNKPNSKSVLFLEQLFRAIQTGKPCFRLSSDEQGWLFVELPGEFPREFDCFPLQPEEYRVISNLMSAPAFRGEEYRLHLVREIGSETFTFRYTTIAYSKRLARRPQCVA